MRVLNVGVTLAFVGCALDTGVSERPDIPEFTPAPPIDRTLARTDEFLHTVDIPTADVLWVIDGSCSMTQELQFLSDHFPTFMDIIDDSSVDYRVAVTGTNMSDPGRLMIHFGKKWIDRDTNDPINAFVQMVDAAGSQGWSGYNFDATKGCLDQETGDCITSGFRRPDSPIHSIVVTDEAVRGDVSPEAFINWYRSLDEHPPNRQFSGILDLRATGGYVSAINQIGGVVRDVSIADWEELLQDFANRARSSAEQREFFLTQMPVPETLSVEVRPAELGDDVTTAPLDEDLWFYIPDKNSVVLQIEELPEGDYRTFLRYDVRTTTLE